MIKRKKYLSILMVSLLVLSACGTDTDIIKENNTKAVTEKSLLGDLSNPEKSIFATKDEEY